MGPAKEIAQIGWVIGREFNGELLAQVLDEDVDLDLVLQPLVSSQLVFRTRRDGGDAYTFKHALVQDVAYDSLLRPSRSIVRFAHPVQAAL